MYPNPQDALPLPPHPDVEQYRKLAKDLVKACKSADPLAVRVWATRWLRTENNGRLEQLEQFARKKLSGQQDDRSAACKLTDAQFVIARAHGFLSWPKFVAHLEALARSNSTISAFEAAVIAIVTGASATLERLLNENPALIRARSTREHRATLLHYVSANGVENHRQVSPGNIADIADMLLTRGAEVDAVANVYGGECTPLALVATSAPPQIAGVQKELIDVLLKYGARMDLPGMGGNRHALIRACLANGQPEAAEYLMARGAPLDLPGAAGMGRVEAVKRFVNDNGSLRGDASLKDLRDGFALACAYGRTDVVEFLLDRACDVDTELKEHGDGHTGLHVAAFHGHIDVVKTLLRRGARVDAIDKTWHTSPLWWALTGWCETAANDADCYYDVVTLLVAAGANVTAELSEWEKVRADPKMHAALARGAQRS